MSLGAWLPSCAEVVGVTPWPDGSGGATSLSSSTSTGGGGGSGAVGGEVATGSCSDARLVVDDFTVDSGAWQLVENDELVQVALGGGEARVSFSVGSSSAGRFKTWDAYNLTGSSVAVNVSQALAPDSKATPVLRLMDPAGTEAEARISVAGPFLLAQVVDGTGEVTTTAGSKNYVPEEDARWHIYEEDGTLFFETSTDSGRFQPLGQVATSHASPLEFVRVELAGEPNDEPGAGYVAFTQLNVDRPAGTWCTADSLRDDFSGTTARSIWSSTGSNECLVSQDDELIILPMPDVGTDCGYMSWIGHRLTEAGVRVRASIESPESPSYAALHLIKDSTHQLIMEVWQEQLRVVVSNGGDFVDLAVGGYQPDAHAFWRIRTDGTDVLWETSANGVDFDVLHTEPVPFELTGLQIALLGGTSAPVSRQTQIRFDDLNLAPGD